MKNFRKFLLLILVISNLFLTSCTDNQEELIAYEKQQFPDFNLNAIDKKDIQTPDER